MQNVFQVETSLGAPRWFSQRQALFWLAWQSCTKACISGNVQSVPSVEVVKDTVTQVITWSIIPQYSSQICLAFHFSSITLLCFDNCNIDLL